MYCLYRGAKMMHAIKSYILCLVDMFRKRENWRCNRTCRKRYRINGAEYHIYEEAGKRGTAKVIDVGCSDGAAMREVQDSLANLGIRIETTGVDLDYYKKISETAERNLDNFFPGDITKITELDGTADIVVCANMIRLGIEPERRMEIFRKCVKLARPGGVLVTDRDVWEKVRDGTDGDLGIRVSCADPGYIPGKGRRWWNPFDDVEKKTVRFALA